MKLETFEKRLSWLTTQRFEVLPLNEALDSLARGDLPPDATVITFDDGWYGFYRLALPLMKKHGFPATVYVTTYYAAKETQVYNLVVQYLFWKTEIKKIDISILSKRLHGEFDLSNDVEQARATSLIIEHGEKRLDANARQKLLRSLGTLLEIDLLSLEDRKLFRLMSLDEMKCAVTQDIDIQLHTHRHSLSFEDRDSLGIEIQLNRSVLASVSKSRLEHLCYPGGMYNRRQWPWLEALGVKSATTCSAGFVYRATPRLELNRFLDGEDILDIEFEAELCGVLETLRILRSGLSNLLP